MSEENKDLRKQRREKILLEKKQAANSLRWKLDDMSRCLKRDKKFLGRSEAYENLCIAVNFMLDQVSDDEARYKRILENKSAREEMQELQQALNRERKLRQELENKISEATTSSGLFIKYVRDKLGV